jgi:hypothetical protein
MWKSALAGALAFVAVGIASLPSSAQGLSEGHIAQARAALNLTPEQARHWPRVAAALRAFNRQTSVQVADASEEGGWKAKAAGLASKAAAARRVMAAAGPLLKTLSPEQRSTAMAMVRSAGYGHLIRR